MKPRAWIVEFEDEGEWWAYAVHHTRREAKNEARYLRERAFLAGKIYGYRVREYVPKEKP